MRTTRWHPLLLLPLLASLTFAAGMPGMAASNRLLPFPYQTNEAVRDLAWIPGDGQHHSTYSDGLAKVSEVMARAKANGLGWLIFTDHTQNVTDESFLRQVAEVGALSNETGVIGIVGEEIGSINISGTNAHFLMLNINKHPGIGDNSLLMLDLLARVHSLQPEDPPIGIIAHPAQKFHEWLDWPRELVGGIELISGTRNKPAPQIAINRWQWYCGRQLASALDWRSRLLRHASYGNRPYSTGSRGTVQVVLIRGAGLSRKDRKCRLPSP